LAEIGINLTLSELIKIVKIFPINENNEIYFPEFLDRLGPIDANTKAPISEK
jgi:Ca2+-binding EF-hand superfamily protein